MRLSKYSMLFAGLRLASIERGGKFLLETKLDHHPYFGTINLFLADWPAACTPQILLVHFQERVKEKIYRARYLTPIGERETENKASSPPLQLFGGKYNLQFFELASQRGRRRRRRRTTVRRSSSWITVFCLKENSPLSLPQSCSCTLTEETLAKLPHLQIAPNYHPSCYYCCCCCNYPSSLFLNSLSHMTAVDWKKKSSSSWFQTKQPWLISTIYFYTVRS